ncbi:MAG TPA: DUF2007 domain-containing protein [Solirubrobacteraceae bacterium]|nr:DUF2007 domain-containing protein [Solirubrobacteraceae bacterium]
MLKFLTTAADEVEATSVVDRLSEAGIRCMRTGSGIGRVGFRSGLDLMVEEQDLASARKIVEEAAGGFDEAELERLSMQAGRQAQEQTPPAEPA